jgi:PIN domain nuclease of toxin-antitoxin system
LTLLLDSHVLLWWFDGTPSLLPTTHRAIEHAADEVLVSAASIWEIEVKRLKGKLVAPSDIVDRVENLGFRLLDVTADHALDAARLPPHHRDPFDRFLVAQAQAEAAILVSDDEAVTAYDVPIMSARQG